MPESGVRVALLARAGEAREQLRRALSDLGADVVAEGDPAELDPGTVASRQPAFVVVSLEPAVEDALGEFDDLLAMPGVQVIYDDAEVTGQLDGWDLARWARHLASKLAGDGHVLPPPPADAEGLAADATPEIQPGAPPTPAEEMDHHRLEDYAAESLDLSDWVPVTPSLADVAVEPVAGPAAEPVAEPGLDLELDLEIDLSDLEQAMATPVADAPAEAEVALPDVAAPSASAGADDGATPEPDLADFLDLSVADFDAGASAPAAEAPSEAPLLVDFELSDEPVNFSSFGGDDDAVPVGVDDDVAALAAQLEAFERAAPSGEVREPDFARAAGDEPPAFDAPLALDAPSDRAPGAPSPAAPSFEGFGTLELAPMDGAAPAPAPAARPALPPDEPVKVSFGTLSLVDDDAPAAAAPARPAAPAPSAPAPASTLSLVDDGLPPAVSAPAPSATASAASSGTSAGLSPAEEAPAAPARAARRGALFVVAGLGGPDGVRQLLAALPADLPVPVLLYQHLDTGKHDRLVGQLAKASRLPLELAVVGQRPAAGRVAVLPPGIGVRADGDAFEFVPGGTLGAIVGTLPAADSAVLVLSGGDPAVVPSVQAMQSAGGRVFAQDPASCFDAGAPQALIASGAATAPVPGLARLISECWS